MRPVRPEHASQQKPAPAAQQQQQTTQQKPMPAQFGMDIGRDIRALNSSILIISQKLQYIVRNEKILGRNLLIVNKKLKELEEKGGGHSSSIDAEGDLAQAVSSMRDSVSKLSANVSEMQAELENIRQTYAKDSLVKEMKYVVDAINPLEFVTYKDVERIVEEKLKRQK
jgi:vacuolar-type H+-ATPase subunit I/STV1